VEDEILISWALVKSLSKSKFDVTVIDTGEKACELIESNQYDLVITDVNLPQIDGFQVVALVKGKYPDTPVIIMSALAENSTQNSKTYPKKERFIEKPFNITEMMETINELLLK
jgi:two-component system, OmpR family, response regulator